MKLNRRAFSLVAAAALIPFALGASGASAQTKPSAKKTKAMAEKAPGDPVVVMKTSLGTIKIELDQEKAPITVKNFLTYVDEKHYDGTIFHRTISNFMIQGGGFGTDRKQKPVHDQIKNEAGNGLKNDNYTIAMARTGVVDSATSQFFINVKNNGFLNHKDETPGGYGYCVFGKVIDGKDVVDKIKKVKTRPKGGGALSEGEPVELVVIESVRLEK